MNDVKEWERLRAQQGESTYTRPAEASGQTMPALIALLAAAHM